MLCNIFSQKIQKINLQSNSINHYFCLTDRAAAIGFLFLVAYGVGVDYGVALAYGTG